MLKGNCQSPNIHQGVLQLLFQDLLLETEIQLWKSLYRCYSFCCRYSLLDLILLATYKCLQHNKTKKKTN